MAGGPFTRTDNWHHAGVVDRTTCDQTLRCIRKYADVIQSAWYSSESKLKEAVASGAYELTNRTLDSDNIITTATVKWPNGATGVFTTIQKNTEFLVIDSYSITYYGSSVQRTITQPTVTRNSDGEITVKPELVVS